MRRWFAEHGDHLTNSWLRSFRFRFGLLVYLTGFASLARGGWGLPIMFWISHCENRETRRIVIASITMMYEQGPDVQHSNLV